MALQRDEAHEPEAGDERLGQASRSEVRVQREDFNVDAEQRRMQARGGDDIGAVASFIGLVRADHGAHALMLESYPGMTERSLQAVTDEACERWPLREVLVVHRIGELRVGERIVLAMVAADHRHAAFAACEFIMDYLKTRAVLWKKELHGIGGRWIGARASDEQASRRWR